MKALLRFLGVLALLSALGGMWAWGSAVRPKKRKRPAPIHKKVPKPSKRSKPSKPSGRPKSESHHEQASKTGLEGQAALEPFFHSLRALEMASAAQQDGARLRVLHFGDSHVAADYWSGRIRSELQRRFGDGGPGYIVPGKPWAGFHHKRARGLLEGEPWRVTGIRRNHDDGRYGLSGVALEPGSGRIGLRAEFRTCELLCLGEGRPPLVELDGICLEASDVAQEGDAPPPENRPHLKLLKSWDYAPEPLRSFAPSYVLSDEAHQLFLEAQGSLRLLGVDLSSGKPGIAWDCLGINGAELPDWLKWKPELLEALLRGSQPALVVLSYGTNDMGRPDFSFSEYRSLVIQVLQRLRRALPETSILITGPIDRGSRNKRQLRRLRITQPQVIQALREAARETHCAFWEGRRAMGGDIRRWAAQGLAQRDHVHLTVQGYERLGDLFVEALLEAYQAFCHSRNEAGSANPL